MEAKRMNEEKEERRRIMNKEQGRINDEWENVQYSMLNVQGTSWKEGIKTIKHST